MVILSGTAIHALLTFAGDGAGSAADEFSNHAGLSPAIKQALEKKKELQIQADAERAAEAIMQLTEIAANHIAADVAAIRRARAAEKKAKDSLDTLNRAKSYAEQTGNYIPLAILLGAAKCDFPTDAVIAVPADWIAK